MAKVFKKTVDGKTIIEITYQEGRFTICANGECVADKINVETAINNLDKALALATQMYGELEDLTPDEIEEYQAWLEDQKPEEKSPEVEDPGNGEDNIPTEEQPLVDDDPNDEQAPDVIDDGTGEGSGDESPEVNEASEESQGSEETPTDEDE